MRVISGIAKGRKLKAVKGDSTRPITDRVKVALFDILAVELEGSTFLDLFAGTGAVGIEALSRGAEHAVFVDCDPRAVQTIRNNLASTGLESRATVIRSDSFQYLQRQSHQEFDFVYIAPPQYKQLWTRALKILETHTDWLSPDGTVVVQIHPREYCEWENRQWREYDRRKYGNTLLLFLEFLGKYNTTGLPRGIHAPSRWRHSAFYRCTSAGAIAVLGPTSPEVGPWTEGHFIVPRKRDTKEAPEKRRLFCSIDVSG
jgi:16S rRNA (guanine966-N2)-methyltransferase